jgi:hypothetical protein
MKKALKNNNKENLFPLGDRYNSQGKSGRDEFVLKTSKRK